MLIETWPIMAKILETNKCPPMGGSLNILLYFHNRAIFSYQRKTSYICINDKEIFMIYSWYSWYIERYSWYIYIYIHEIFMKYTLPHTHWIWEKCGIIQRRLSGVWRWRRKRCVCVWNCIYILIRSLYYFISLFSGNTG